MSNRSWRGGEVKGSFMTSCLAFFVVFKLWLGGGKLSELVCTWILWQNAANPPVIKSDNRFLILHANIEIKQPFMFTVLE